MAAAKAEGEAVQVGVKELCRRVVAIAIAAAEAVGEAVEVGVVAIAAQEQ